MVKKVTVCIASCLWVLLLFSHCGSLARGPEDNGGVLAKSTFDADAEGWSTAGDALSITFHDTGGSSGDNGGYVSALDKSLAEPWYFVAPAAFLGDQERAYGGSLDYDLKQDTLYSQLDFEEVIFLTGKIGQTEETLIYKCPDFPGLDWTAYTVPLKARRGWSKQSDGTKPTRAEMREVLSTLKDLRIRGEYSSRVDMGSLDSVYLRSRARR